MALMQPWLGALLVLLIVVAGAAGWRRWRRTVVCVNCRVIQPSSLASSADAAWSWWR